MMKSIVILCLAGLMITLTGCTYRQYDGAATGSYLGGMFGSAIGGIAGGYRGENVGTLVGMIAGGAIGAAATADKSTHSERYNRSHYGNNGDEYYGREYGYTDANEGRANWSGLEVRNIRFVDANHNSLLESDERAYVTMEIYNRSGHTLYDIAPLITCDNRRIAISPTAIVSTLKADDGFRYKIEIVGARRLKDGTATFTIAFGTKRSSYTAGHFRIRTRR